MTNCFLNDIILLETVCSILKGDNQYEEGSII